MYTRVHVCVCVCIFIREFFIIFHRDKEKLRGPLGKAVFHLQSLQVGSTFREKDIQSSCDEFLLYLDTEVECSHALVHCLVTHDRDQ